MPELRILTVTYRRVANPPAGMKQCSGCGELKPVDDFPRNRSRKDGRNSHCRPCDYARSRQWKLQHPEEAKVHLKRYYANVHNAPQYAYEKRNKAAQDKRRRDWKKRNLERIREYARRRYWLKINSQLGEVDTDAILARYGRVCHICGGAIPDSETIHFDHVRPLSKGGAHSEDNIRPAHALCNLRKGARVEDRVAARRAPVPPAGRQV